MLGDCFYCFGLHFYSSNCIGQCFKKKEEKKKIFTHARYIYTQFQTVHKEGPGQYLGQYR